jgi:hypothetical protein
MRPPPPTARMRVSTSWALVVEDLEAECARSGGDRRLVVGVAVHGTGRLCVFDRRRVCLGVLTASQHHVRAVRAELVDLDRWGVGGHEYRRRYAERAGCERVRQAGVSTRRDHDADPRIEAFLFGCADDSVEGSADLERPGVLEILKLEPTGAAERSINGEQRSTPHTVGDSFSGRLDIGACDHLWPPSAGSLDSSAGA